ncbi:MAG: DNA recombination protein RmuC [Eubacteriales bacterium]|nr:DNA recombination protein RmuC [Lachnospiraceae bacterium]MDD5860494.1 DNA recombination protein RmuC [Eubacteriales bacterium]MCH4063350.1 DNA recombination protein RmuC [Lachnospiraceae bacterium]MCH4104501.1 DNA recombination protein RmuC [Lachnospiraceae bacterium]MCI1309218.1 DNA recombination protein RmuC [Lachnospiraceae bacterium]
MGTAEMIFLYVLLLVVILLMAVILIRQGRQGGTLPPGRDSHDELVRIAQRVESGNRANQEASAQLRAEVSDALRRGLKTQSEQLLNASKLQTDSLVNLQDRVIRTLQTETDRLQQSNEEKLEEIRGVVSDKLDRTLNERLDSNFKTIGDQLGRLYHSLGELQSLSEGVTDLNRTLSNVKTRGTWGEVQLGRILEQTLTRAQYDENVATKKNSSDRVEFAVKFPAQDGTGDTVYLPIDSKFPTDLYNHIVDASSRGDQEAMDAAVTALKNRMLDEARTIRDKYLDPPRTTNYAIMFLPTEGLYAEVLRIEGLSEKCQNLGILIAGPTTITAILNSLQAGFRSIALSQKSVEVMKLLEAVKAQFGRMDEEITKTQKKLSEAVSSTDKLHHRTQIITRRMRNIGDMDIDEAKSVLDLEDGADMDGSSM